MKNKQLEFINGGVSLNDEACTHYEDIIDNMTWDHQFILDNFGIEAIPTIGWQIHSVTARLKLVYLIKQDMMDGLL